jgi:tetratricopeptide (TPR) repeat protein
MNEKMFRVFVSSPGDAVAERQRVGLVLERLNGEFEGRARFVPVFWEDQIYSAHATFQAQITEAAECDLVLAIFRARLGTPLPDDWPKVPETGQPYPSGSAYEVLTAIEARQSGKPLPDVYVFRYKDAPNPSLDSVDRIAIEADWERLKRFFDTWFKNPSGEFIAAFQWYQSTDDLAQQTEKCLRNWLVDRDILSEGPIWDRALNGCPFPGLAAFDADRRAVFFGRELAINSAIFHLRQASWPFLLIIGASGSGKSSLLCAGLVPELVTPGIIPEVEIWRAAVMIADGEPFAQLAQCLLMETALGPELQQGAFGTPEILAKQLRTDLDTATLPLQESLDRAANTRRETVKSDTKPHVRLLLAIDQAERWFTENIPSETINAINAFAALLESWVEHALVTLILTLRSDAYTAFQNVPALLHLRESGATFDLVPPTSVELEEMVTRPLLACRPPLKFAQCNDESLARRLVNDARGGDVLPLLQITLQRLYVAEEKRKDGILSCDDYHGMEEAVTEEANKALFSVDEEARGQLPALVKALVQDVISDPSTGAAMPVVVAVDRAAFEAQHPERRALVDAFVANRLLSSEGDASSQRVRPTHESLLRIWPQAKTIVEENAALIRVENTLRPMVRAWSDATEAKKIGYLDLPPALLDGAQQLVAHWGPDLDTEMRDFIAQAVARDVEERDRGRQMQEQRIRDAEAVAAANRKKYIYTGVLSIVAVAMLAVASWEWHRVYTEKVAEAKILEAAVKSSDAMVLNIALRFRNLVGVPTSLIEDVLGQALKLDDQLQEGAPRNLALQRSQAGALTASARTLLILGETHKALKEAQRARKIILELPASQAIFSFLYLQDMLIGQIYMAQGNLTDSLPYIHQAQQFSQKMQKLDPSDTLSWQANLGGSDMVLGTVFARQGNPSSALNAFHQAQTIFQTLLKSDRTNTGWMGNLAGTDGDLGVALLSLGHQNGALSSYLEARAIIVKLRKADRTDRRWSVDLGLADNNIGHVLNDQKHPNGALSFLEEARHIFVMLLKTDGTNMELQAYSGLVDLNLGITFTTLGHQNSAIKVLREAQTIYQELVKQEPNNATNLYRLKWANGLLQALGK